MSELCGINISDVDFDMGRILVRGKGNKQRFVYLGALLKHSIRMLLPTPGLHRGVVAFWGKCLLILGQEDGIVRVVGLPTRHIRNTSFQLKRTGFSFPHVGSGILDKARFHI